MYTKAMELVHPSVAYKDSYLAALEEPDLMQKAVLCDDSMAKTDFSRFVSELKEHVEGKHLPEGYVPELVLWLVEDGEYIGRVGIRLQLTEKLLQIGGHIGYLIRPSKRGIGYGSCILELALLKAREQGIGRVLVTCSTTNTASRKIIEKNGGVLENQVTDTDGGPDKLRFWIEVPSP
jgi:predicted acetyltransferase